LTLAFEHQAEARRKQNVAVLGAFAPIDENFAGIEVDIADLDVDELAHAYSRIEEQFEQDLVLHVAAVLDGSEEPFQIGVGKQLRQPALFASPAQAQLLAGLLRDIEEIVVPQPGLARDPHELSHDGFRLFIWRYEVTPLCDPFGFHSSIPVCILLRLLAIVRNRILAPAWGHLNLLGEYDFSEDKLQDSVGIKLPKLTD
jgi:hypothetical protein